MSMACPFCPVGRPAVWLIAEQGKTRAAELKLKAAGKPLDAPSAAIMSSF